MGGRSSNPSGNQRPVGAQQRNMAQSQAAVQQQQQQQQAKLKFNANARNQPDALPAGGQAAVGGDRGQGIQVNIVCVYVKTKQLILRKILVG